ncbi:MAG: 16S rRNA (guanine(527)-N(7))-methyltransferase RsmG [Candidatus Cryptobacteroides sp.]|nr:16S rRNA (guanine(527)-N(7))-methyltransferase RsmG [Candidatus Cryptobacteroides sp.]
MIGFADFEAFLKASFPDMTDGMVERFRLMDAGYRDWNAKINVISRKDIDSLYDHHVLHSLAIAEYLRTQRPGVYSMFTAPLQEGSVAPVSSSTNVNASRAGLRVLDLGTGGGFPGIPLAVMFPNVRFTLCDSVGKKTIVAREIANMLGLDNVEIVNARAESLPGRFDFVVSRAVASLTDFYPWVKGKYSQSILYLKGGDINEEICALMSRERLRKGSVSTWPVTTWLSDPYFAGKFVIDIRR